MKCKMTPLKVCAAMILGIVTFGFTMSSLDSALTRYERRNDLSPGFVFEERSPQTMLVSEITQIESEEPLARLFQLLFILFIISPPIIALMLFLIWKELRAKNKMK